MWKRAQECRTVPGRCVNCRACRIIDEGPNKGRCIYGGPFIGYQRYDGNRHLLGGVHVAERKRAAREFGAALKV